MTRVRFTVHGTPQPAGSKRGFINPKTRGVIVTDANAKARPWKALVTDAAAEHMTYHDPDGTSGYLPPLEGPLRIELDFIVPRPKGHYGTKGVKGSAPSHPTVKPDVLKLARAVEDALSGVIYRDDAQIVTEWLTKRYGEPARVEVTVTHEEDT